MDNYVVNYEQFCQGEITEVISNFSTDATDEINLTAVIARLRGLLPGIVDLDRKELEGLDANKLTDQLMELVYDNEENGQNLYQLFQAMNRFLPLFPPVPNLGSLAARKSGQRQLRENVRRDYLERVRLFIDEFVTEQVALDATEREQIWQAAEDNLTVAFNNFNVEGLSAKNAPARQLRFKQSADKILQQLLMDTISAMDGEQLEMALAEFVQKQQNKWA